MMEYLVNIAQILSVFLTFVTLFFVWRELRNVERNQKASSVHSIAESERELWLSAINDSDMAQLLAMHLRLSPQFLQEIKLSPENALRIMLFFKQYENIYYQHVHGMLPDNLWGHWRKSMEYTFFDPVVQKLFNRVEANYSVDFKNFIKKDLVPNLSVFPRTNSEAKNEEISKINE